MSTVILDVAFSSDTDPIAGSKLPIVIAYAFVSDPEGSGVWTSKGQTGEHIQAGSQLMFEVFDTSPSSTTDMVSSLEISFGEGITPFVDPATNPPTALASPIIIAGTAVPVGLAGQTSTGCNIVGMRWGFSAYTLMSDIPNGTPFECTITVQTKNSKTFAVDPEVIVEGGD